MTDQPKDPGLTREDVIEMLKAGKVEKWNALRQQYQGWAPHLGQVDLQGAKLDGARLHETCLTGADLAGAELRDARFFGANLDTANLAGADLRHADLTDASVRNARLDSANLKAADLIQTDFSSASLVETNFSKARLFGTNFIGPNLAAANFDKASIALMQLADTDLSTGLHLDQVVHEAPSSIGVDTIIKSRGKIPKVFLEGCGVPNVWIDYIPALIASVEPIQFFSCFLSHSGEDAEFCDKLYDALRKADVPLWYSRRPTRTKRLRGGAPVDEQLPIAVRTNDRLLIVLSEHSMKAPWVERELAEAVKHQDETGKRKLFPIGLVPFEKIKDWKCTDPDTGRDLARECRRYYIPNFSNWQDETSFQKELQLLLDDLKKDDPLRELGE